MTTRLEHELGEQPEALQRFLDAETQRVLELVPQLMTDDVKYIVVAARGTSDNAARYLQYLLGVFNRLPVMLATPSLYTIYDAPPRLDGALVVGISQSGESPDVVEVLREARRQGRPSIAITNSPSSPLGLAADAVVKLEAGKEQAVAATKTYLNSLGAIALIFATTTGDARALVELEAVPGQIQAQLERSQQDVVELDRLGSVDGGTVVARGINYCTSYEVALKIRELSGLLFEAYSAADLMHGPVAAIGRGWPVIAVAPSGPALAAMEAAIADVSRRGARLVVVSDERRVLDHGEVGLPLVAGVPEWLSPLVAVVPGQLAAMRLAELRGVDLDNPLGLSKITLTR